MADLSSRRLRSSLVFIILLFAAATPATSSFLSTEDILSFSSRDSDYCEDTYDTETACNADSQCEWDAESDPSDSDYPGECEDREEDDEDDDEDDDDEDDEEDDNGGGNNGGGNNGGGSTSQDFDNDGTTDDLDLDDDNDGWNDGQDGSQDRFCQSDVQQQMASGHRCKLDRCIFGL